MNQLKRTVRTQNLDVDHVVSFTYFFINFQVVLLLSSLWPNFREVHRCRKLISCKLVATANKIH